MLAAERRFNIMKLVQKQKVVTTSELAALFDISEMTIRRDVTKLSQDGLLEKTHGGAMTNEIVTLGPSFSEKEIIHL
ncbi:DeoR/GlpR transcriptional regulator [bacterium]|nr:DeoR/GlpR transcriptional regulator [bacterium]